MDTAPDSHTGATARLRSGRRAIFAALLLAASLIALLALSGCGPSQADTELRDRVVEQVNQSEQLAAANLEVEVERGEIEIRGELSTQRQKADLFEIVQKFKDEGHTVRNLTSMQQRDSNTINRDAYGTGTGLGL